MIPKTPSTTPYRNGDDWLIAGFYCEHDSLGHTCQACRDTVVDVLCAMRDAGFVTPERTRPSENPPSPEPAQEQP